MNDWTTQNERQGTPIPRRLPGLISLVLALTAPQAVLAQAPGDEEAGTLEEVVVTGTRKEGRLPTETLSPVDMISGEALDYQASADERSITEQAAGVHDLDPGWVANVVELVRLTRSHPDLRVGSSVRGAIDMCAVASSLAELRGGAASDRDVSLDAALVALSGRVRLREGTTRSAEEIVEELWASVFRRDDADGSPEGKATAPIGATADR